MFHSLRGAAVRVSSAVLRLGGAVQPHLSSHSLRGAAVKVPRAVLELVTAEGDDGVRHAFTVKRCGQERKHVFVSNTCMGVWYSKGSPQPYKKRAAGTTPQIEEMGVGLFPII